jgi:hypothetical protein
VLRFRKDGDAHGVHPAPHRQLVRDDPGGGRCAAAGKSAFGRTAGGSVGGPGRRGCGQGLPRGRCPGERADTGPGLPSAALAPGRACPRSATGGPPGSRPRQRQNQSARPGQARARRDGAARQAPAGRSACKKAFPGASPTGGKAAGKGPAIQPHTRRAASLEDDRGAGAPSQVRRM